MGTILNRTEQVFAIGRKNSWWLFDSALHIRRSCDEFLNLISKVHGFQLGFSSHPHSPKRWFRISFLSRREVDASGNVGVAAGSGCWSRD